MSSFLSAALQDYRQGVLPSHWRIVIHKGCSKSISDSKVEYGYAFTLPMIVLRWNS
jgi:hypothetical protein